MSDPYKLTVHLTAPNLPDQIDECKRKIDTWLRGIKPPSVKSGKMQVLELVKKKPLTYRLSLEPLSPGMPRTILKRGNGDE